MVILALKQALERLRERPVLKRVGGFFGQIRSPSISVSVQAAPVATLTINADRTRVTEGETITFTGTITRNGTPIYPTPIDLYRDNVRVVQGDALDSSGYRIRWVADVVGSFNFRVEAPLVT